MLRCDVFVGELTSRLKMGVFSVSFHMRLHSILGSRMFLAWYAYIYTFVAIEFWSILGWRARRGPYQGIVEFYFGFARPVSCCES